MLPTTITMSSLKGCQDDGNVKSGQSNELEAATTTTAQREENHLTAICHHKRRRTRKDPAPCPCDICPTGIIVPSFWRHYKPRATAAGTDTTFETTTRSRSPPPPQQQQQQPSLVRCHACLCSKPQPEFSPQQWNAAFMELTISFELPVYCLSCLSIDQEWNQVIQQEWCRDGPVVQRLFHRHQVSMCHIPMTTLPLMENSQALQQLREDLPEPRVYGSSSIEYDVLLVHIHESREEMEDSFFIQRTLGVVSQATLTLHLFQGHYHTPDDPRFCGQTKFRNDNGEVQMDYIFKFNRSLVGTMIKSQTPEVLGYSRSLHDCCGSSLRVIKEPISLPWIPADNIHPDSRYAQHMRAQWERWHANQTARQHEGQLLWLTRHKDLPQVVSDRIYEYATSPRPCPQFQLQKGDVVLQAKFRQCINEGSFTWIARPRRPDRASEDDDGRIGKATSGT